MRARLLLAGVGLLTSAASGQSVRDGIAAWSRGDAAKAVATWHPLAARGDPDAMYNLGQAYRLGRGVPTDLAKAQLWYTRAARAGHLDAQASLGILLFQNGTRAEGLRWLRTAADRGDARGQLLVGTALFNGDSIARDPALAYAYISKAAAQGLAPAKVSLAEMDAKLPLSVRRKGLALASKRGGKTVVEPAPQAAAPPPPLSGLSPRPSGTLVPRSIPTAAIATGPRNSAPAPHPGAAGNWRVQLGAFSQRAAAEALFRKLAAGPLAGKQPVFTAVGAMIRLQVGPFATHADATASCSALAARGQACFAVPAR